jgi:hypothetical protein
MAYVINKTNGGIFATVADGTIDTSSSMTIVGRNYSGYGEFLGENFVKILENSANSSAPGNPLEGQLWYDSTNDVLSAYNGTEFKTFGSLKVSGTEPSTSLTSGDMWFDSGNSQLHVYDGSSFALVGPPTSVGSGTTGFVSVSITDDSAVSHTVIKLLVEDVIVGFISDDAEFTPSPAIAGFTSIKPGFGFSSAVTGASVTQADNSSLLDNLASSDFLRATANDTTSGTLGVLNDSGLSIGADSDVNISVSGSDATIKNITSDGDLILSVNDGGVQTNAISVDGATTDVTITGSILASVNNTKNIGTATEKFNTIYATTFSGVASEAQYADLAERFEADDVYEAGTVVEMGGINEITEAVEELTDNVFGVISTNAAYLMNAGAGANNTHPPVAMNGRVPVKVIGKVKKGDRLVSAGNGFARVASVDEITAFNVIGRALKNKTSNGKGTVEVIVKVN